MRISDWISDVFSSDLLKGIGRYEFGWADSDDAGATAQRGLNDAVVRDISAKKGEPQWMLDLRLKGLKLFDRKQMKWGGSDLRTEEGGVGKEGVRKGRGGWTREEKNKKNQERKD